MAGLETMIKLWEDFYIDSDKINSILITRGGWEFKIEVNYSNDYVATLDDVEDVSAFLYANGHNWGYVWKPITPGDEVKIDGDWYKVHRAYDGVLFDVPLFDRPQTALDFTEWKHVVWMQKDKSYIGMDEDEEVVQGKYIGEIGHRNISFMPPVEVKKIICLRGENDRAFRWVDSETVVEVGSNVYEDHDITIL